MIENRAKRKGRKHVKEIRFAQEIIITVIAFTGYDYYTDIRGKKIRARPGHDTTIQHANFLFC